MFEGVRKGVRRMARAFDDDHESRRRWRLGLAWASAAAVGVLLLALVRLASVSPPPSGSAPLVNTPESNLGDEALTEDWNPDQPTHEGLVDTADAGESLLRNP